MLPICNIHALFKMKHLRENYVSFVTKELRKAVIQLSYWQRKTYVKKWTETAKVCYSYQPKNCVSLLKKWRRSSFENLSIKLVKNNKSFVKTLRPFFQAKLNPREDSYLFIKKKIISNDKEITDTFQELFVAKTLNISENSDLISQTSQTDSVL